MSELTCDIYCVPGGRIPEYMSEGAACCDCYSRISVEIPAGARLLVPLGFALALPKGYEAVIRPRSGMSKIGLDSTIGTIDSDYRGEVMACIVNNSGTTYKIEQNARVCQMKIQRAERFRFIPAPELSETERGGKGFGSTGV